MLVRGTSPIRSPTIPVPYLSRCRFASTQAENVSVKEFAVSALGIAKAMKVGYNLKSSHINFYIYTVYTYPRLGRSQFFYRLRSLYLD